MKKKSTKSGILTIILAIIITTTGVAQTWPCAQYLTRQVPNGSAYQTNISYIYTLGTSSPPATVTVAKLDTLLNASAIYNGYIWGWKQYTGTAESGSGGQRLIRVSYNNGDSTITPAITGYTFSSITMNSNAGCVDPNGIFYVISTATSGASSFILSRINLSTSTPTLLTNLTVTLPSGSTVGSGGLGDLVYTVDSIYFLLNNVGLFRFALPSTSTTSITASLVGSSINRTIGSLFYVNSDPQNVYGYGSANGASTQDRIIKISKINGAVTELTTGGIQVSQSDGAGCPASNFSIPVFYSISGTVYDDANGMTDKMVNGTGTNAGNKIYAQLIDSISGEAILNTAVASNGTYTFSGLSQDTYTILIDTISSLSNSTVLPMGWVNTGEIIGTGTGSDGSANGISASISLTSNVINVNFGIEQLPTANPVTAASQPNPGGTNTVVVPTLNGSDPEQGAFTGTDNVDTVIINTLPANGTLYYNGVAIPAGDTIKNYNPTLLTVHPDSGAVTVTFTYSEVDAALKSSTPATVTIPFTALSISGIVYDDANGMTDNLVNGTGTNAGNKIYAQLINSSGVAIANTAVASNGTYTFSGLNEGTFKVLIDTISSLSNSTVLPVGWVNTGEIIGTGTGSDGSANGISASISLTSNVINVNFGIEQLPTANPVTAASQPNPGGTNTVVVPTLNGSDPEQGAFTGTDNVDTVIINTLPANGTLYYNGVAIPAGDTIKNYNPTLLTVHPDSGAVTVTFTYSEVDAALKSSTPATVTIPFTALSISGIVYDDANGMTDNLVNGTGTNAGNKIYAQLINSSGVAIANTAVASNGTYTFSGLNEGTYTVLIDSISSLSNSTVLPVGWVNTGEIIGTGTGSDGSANGISASISLTSNVTNVNFGIEQLPTANPVTAASQPNPGGTNTVVVPTLNGSDPEQGAFTGTDNVDTVIINTLPANGTLYYNGVAIPAGDTIKNYNPTLLTVHPDSGAVTVTFTYSEVDAALKSSTPATVTIPFTALSISGIVYDDANGMTDNLVNGTGTNAGNKIYAQLINSSGVAIANAAVASNGTYTFSGLNEGTYTVLIDSISSLSNSTVLPVGWVNTGEIIGTGTGSDGSANGISASISLTSNVTNVNFGIEQLPTANPVTAASQPNPGGTNTVVVPTLNGSDPEQGAFTGTDNVDTVIINTLPANGTLYYNGVAIPAGDTIKNYNPTLLTVHPDSGAVTVTFTYSEVDAALKSSTPATVTIPFTALSISGIVYDDANGMTDNLVNGTGTNAGNKIYAQLINSSGVAIANTAVASNGTYTFSGLSQDTYTILIDTISSLSNSTVLPMGWVNTGEIIGTGTGSDGSANGISASISLTSNVINVNFGIEQLPTANPVTAASQPNPGGTNTVVVPTLNGSDPEQGAFTGTDNVDTVIINTLPANGTLYYNGVAIPAGDTIKNYNPTLLTVHPDSGAVTVTFTYSEVDAALESSTPATVTIPFTALSISGIVYDDANGMTDNLVNGTGTNAGNKIYAQLINSSGVAIANTGVASNGTYTFSGLNEGTYTVLIDSVSSLSTLTVLPVGWVNTGEIIGTGTGSDGSANGISASISLTSNVTNVNFGIEQLPFSNNKTYSIIAPAVNSMITLNGTGTVPGPMSGSDPEDGILSANNTVIITTVPTNSELYYNGTLVTNNTTITNYNPANLQIKFISVSTLNTSFQYSFVDAAGNQSPVVATYYISWTSTLPVVLSSFTASNQNDYVVLNWTTTSELNVKQFNIERSTDNGKTWQPVGEVIGSGNSSTEKSYSFTDDNPESGSNLYRLQIEDNNGSFTYSQIAQINIQSQSSMNIYPNPVGQEEALNIQLMGLKAGSYQISMVSSSGQTVKAMTFNISSTGSALLVIPTGNMPRGTYIVIVVGNNQQYTKTVVVANR